jgi:hypothetical protein
MLGDRTRNSKANSKGNNPSWGTQFTVAMGTESAPTIGPPTIPYLAGTLSTDTMFASEKSLRGYKTAQVFTNGCGYDRFYTIMSKAEAPFGLIHDDGIPQLLVSDYANEQISVRKDLPKVPHRP